MMTIKRCHLFLHTLTLKKYSTFNYFNLIDPKSLKNGGQKRRMVINLCLGIYIAQAEDEEFSVVDAV